MAEATPRPEAENEVKIPDPILSLLKGAQRKGEAGTYIQEPVLAELGKLSGNDLDAEIARADAEWWKLAGSYQQPPGYGATLTATQMIKDVIVDARRFVNKGRLRDLGDYRMHLSHVKYGREFAKASQEKAKIWEQRFADAEAKGATLGPTLKEAVVKFFVNDRMGPAGYKGNNFLRNEQALRELAAAFPNGRIAVRLAEWTSHKNPHHQVEGDQYDIYDSDNLVHYGLLELFGVKGWE